MTVSALLATVALSAVLFVWYLAYERNPSPPESVQVPGLSEVTTIAWGSRHGVRIRASSYLDATAALGYTHGWRNPWSVIFWRQAALGRLAEWFGDDAIAIDRLTRQLGFATRAEEVAGTLSAEDSLFLEAYTAGLNAALLDPDTPLREDFLQLRLLPAPWQIWHTLALERLLAWLAVPRGDIPSGHSDLEPFLQANRQMRTWLRLHGFEHSIAWIMEDAGDVTLFQRLVYGDAALPVFQRVEVALGAGQYLRGISIPGTPFMPFGITRDFAWSLLPHARASVQRVAARADSGAYTHERLRSSSGNEYLVVTDHGNSSIRLSGDRPDSVWTLTWPGFRAISDIASWRGLLLGQRPGFRLLGGDGLWMDRSGAWAVLGSPPVERSLPSGIFVGLSPSSAFVSDALATREGVAVEFWMAEAYSAWAARRAPALIQAVAGLPALSPAVANALIYLTTWDFTYTSASIAPSIFEAWTQFYESQTGSLMAPDFASPQIVRDTLGLRVALARGVENLTQRLGADQSQWRWERLHPDRRYFPYRTKMGTELMEPMEWAGHGHATSLAWNPAPHNAEPAPNAASEAWHQSAIWGTITIRERSVNPHAPLGIHRASDLLTPETLLSGTLHTTYLEP